MRLLRELNCEFDEYARDERAKASEVVRRAVSECIHRCKSDPRQHLGVYVHRLFQGSTPEHGESCKSLTENMDITGPVVRVWDVFRVTASFEGDLVRDRTDLRLQVNSLKGRKDGHPLKLNMRQLARSARYMRAVCSWNVGNRVRRFSEVPPLPVGDCIPVFDLGRK